MAEIGTKSVHEGGGRGRHHPVRNEGGAGKIVPLHFWTVWSLLKPKQSPVVAWKSPVKSVKIEFYNRSTTESTTTYVDTGPSYDIVVRRL